MQRSALIFSVAGDLIESCERELNALGFFTLFAHAELPARKILHDITIDLALFDMGPDWDASLKLLQRIKGSHEKVPFILMFDLTPTIAREFGALGKAVAGFYNKKAPVKELIIELVRIFPDLRQKTVSGAQK
jgi:DNA-binding NtrC family response regulator